jgi:hypothetical protein
MHIILDRNAKVVFLFNPKVGATTIKKLLCRLYSIPHDQPSMHAQFRAFVEGGGVAGLEYRDTFTGGNMADLLDTFAHVICVVRCPFKRLVSGLADKALPLCNGNPALAQWVRQASFAELVDCISAHARTASPHVLVDDGHFRGQLSNVPDGMVASLVGTSLVMPEVLRIVDLENLSGALRGLVDTAYARPDVPVHHYNRRPEPHVVAVPPGDLARQPFLETIARLPSTAYCRLYTDAAVRNTVAAVFKRDLDFLRVLDRDCTVRLVDDIAALH